MLIKKMAAIVLLVLALSTTFIVLNQTFAQNTDPQKQKAETLFSIIEQTNMTVLSAFSELEQENITPPDGAQTLYDQGLVHATESQSFLQQKDFSEASDQAVLAMKKFEETLRLLESALPLDAIPSTVETALNLKANITRVVNYVEKLENMTKKASTAGYNTLGFEKKLNEINSYLENATRKLRVLNLDGADSDLVIAKTLLEDLRAHVSRLTNLVSKSNVQKYLAEAENRLSATRADISVSATLTAKEKEDALTALNNSETSLSNARDLIEDSNVDGAIEELEEAKRWEAESTATTSAVAVAPSASNTTESPSSIQANTTG